VQDDQHASVEQLSVPVITAIVSYCLVNRETLGDINPALELDTNIVPTPPEQSASSNCEKAVERDVEVYRKKAQSICMYLGVRSANVVSNNAQFSTTIKKQQAICGMFDHRQSNPVRLPRWLWYFEERRDAAPTISLWNCLKKWEPDLQLNDQFQ
jgi:hypothetical protein